MFLYNAFLNRNFILICDVFLIDLLRIIMFVNIVSAKIFFQHIQRNNSFSRLILIPKVPFFRIDSKYGEKNMNAFCESPI